MYAIVIGRKDRDNRYVALHPSSFPDIPLSSYPLAVYKKYQEAREARKRILKSCMHKDVFIKRFEAEK